MFRLRVVAVKRCPPCAWWRAALQRLGIALAQAAWCAWTGLPYLLAYELGALAFLLLSPTGRRLEEVLAGTIIVTAKEYKRRSQTIHS
jgi:uncharacterized RDD family membrane protein YckC